MSGEHEHHIPAALPRPAHFGTDAVHVGQVRLLSLSLSLSFPLSSLSMSSFKERAALSSESSSIRAMQ